MGDSRQSERSPLQSRNRRQKVEVFHQVLCKLRELGVKEAAEPGFEDDLWAHFSMLPHRYALDINTEQAEDVLLHKKLLDMARDPLVGLAVDVRLVQVRPIGDGNLGNSIQSSSTSEGDDLQPDRPLHEITISTTDKPKLLTGLSCLMSEIGLNIQEVHAFSSIHGYSLAFFVVDSWKEETDDLKSRLVNKISNMVAPEDNVNL